jgi:hypothetical protein
VHCASCEPSLGAVPPPGVLDEPPLPLSPLLLSLPAVLEPGPPSPLLVSELLLPDDPPLLLLLLDPLLPPLPVTGCVLLPPSPLSLSTSLLSPPQLASNSSNPPNTIRLVIASP